MSLAIAQLTRALSNLGDPQSADYSGAGTLAEAPQRLAEAYDSYAQSAVDAGQNKLVAGRVSLMEAVLASVFSVPEQTPLAAAQGIAASHVAYWLGAQFAIGLPPAAAGIGGTGIFSQVISSVVVSAPMADLTAGLARLFAAPSTQAQLRAFDVATVWHAATVAVGISMVGIDTTPPPAGPLPVTLATFVS